MGELRDSMRAVSQMPGFRTLKKIVQLVSYRQSPLTLKQQRLSGDSQRAPYNLGLK
jgi:hypothetical protein